MADGKSLGIFQFQADITKNATPQFKVDPYGFLASLYAAHSRGVIKNVVGDSGHFVTVKVKRKRRMTQSDTRDERSCDIAFAPQTVEDTITIGEYCETALTVSEETIAAFDSYASRPVNVNGGDPSVPLMFEFWEDVQIAANALLQCVDDKLVAKAVDNIGENVVTNNNSAKTINIALNTTNNPLANGPTEIFADLKRNSMLSPGTPIVVGAGLFYNYMMQQPAKGIDQSGVNTRILTNQFDFWYDQNVPDELANANHIIVYEKDAVQIVEYLRNKGFKRGPKPGGSTFGTLMLPFIVGDQLIPVEFDYQLKYIDCPTTINVNGYASTVLDRGWVIIISKQFDLYVIPADAYHGSDPLNGNRGSLLYTITNT